MKSEILNALHFFLSLSLVWEALLSMIRFDLDALNCKDNCDFHG